MGARRRRASYAVWDVVVFVLNVLAFILIGLQLRGIMERLGNNIGWSIGFKLAGLCGDRRDTRCVGYELLRSQPMETNAMCVDRGGNANTNSKRGISGDDHQGRSFERR